MLTFFVFLTLVQLSLSCEEGIIVVGGESLGGPNYQVKVLTEQGWCQNTVFPDLPEPLSMICRLYRVFFFGISCRKFKD